MQTPLFFPSLKISLLGEGGRLGCCLQRAAPLYALAASLPTQPLLMPEKAEKGVPRV